MTESGTSLGGQGQSTERERETEGERERECVIVCVCPIVSLPARAGAWSYDCPVRESQLAMGFPHVVGLWFINVYHGLSTLPVQCHLHLLFKNTSHATIGTYWHCMACKYGFKISGCTWGWSLIIPKKPHMYFLNILVGQELVKYNQSTGRMRSH